MERIKELALGYYMGLRELEDALNDAGYEVEDVTMEKVTAWEDGTLFTIRIKWIDGTMLTDEVTAKKYF